MTFSGLDLLDQTYSENGITANGNGDMGLYAAGAVHMDDSGTSAPSRLAFTMGSRFNAVSFDLTPVGFDYSICNVFSSKCDRPTYKNVLVSGLRNGELVSSLFFNMGRDRATKTIKLGDSFTNLTELLIEVIFPTFPKSPERVGDCGYPCSHFEIDNVTLAPVALPATLPMAGSAFAALAGVALFRRRRKA